MDWTASDLFLSILCTNVSAGSTRTLSSQLKGTVSDEFTVEYPLGSQITIVDAGNSPDAPNLLSAVMNSISSEVQVSFDRATNRAKLTTEFDCSQLFKIASIGSKNCVWTDSYTVTMRKAFGVRTSVGDILRLTTLSQQLTAKCVDVSVNCNFYSTIDPNSTVVVQSSTDPRFPVVVVSSPSKVSACDDIVLDMSTTSGTVGQAWKSQTVSVTSTNTNVDTIWLKNRVQQLLLNISDSNGIRFPASWFASDSSYSIFFRFCNSFDFCGSDSVYFTVIKSAAPAVSILGSQSRAVSVSQNITSATSKCNGASVGLMSKEV
jgi:hypothetical protein